MESLRVADAITEVFVLFKRCNKYIDETMPWALAKDEAKKDRLATVLYNLLNGILAGASLLEPFMPETSAKIAEQLKTGLIDFETLEACAEKQDTERASCLYPSGGKVTETPEILFVRRDLKEIVEKLEAMTCVCSVGLDMVAVPGDTKAATISGIIADEMAIGMVNQKTTAVRLIPVIGKGVGEKAEFGGLLGYAPVMPVNQFGCSEFINRGGRIPAPIHSFKN